MPKTTEDTHYHRLLLSQCSYNNDELGCNHHTNEFILLDTSIAFDTTLLKQDVVASTIAIAVLHNPDGNKEIVDAIESICNVNIRKCKEEIKTIFEIFKTKGIMSLPEHTEDMFELISSIIQQSTHRRDIGALMPEEDYYICRPHLDIMINLHEVQSVAEYMPLSLKTSEIISYFMNIPTDDKRIDLVIQELQKSSLPFVNLFRQSSRLDKLNQVIAYMFVPKTMIRSSSIISLLRNAEHQKDLIKKQKVLKLLEQAEESRIRFKITTHADIRVQHTVLRPSYVFTSVFFTEKHVKLSTAMLEDAYNMLSKNCSICQSNGFTCPMLTLQKNDEAFKIESLCLYLENQKMLFDQQAETQWLLDYNKLHNMKTEGMRLLTKCIDTVKYNSEKIGNVLKEVVKKQLDHFITSSNVSSDIVKFSCFLGVLKKRHNFDKSFFGDVTEDCAASVEAKRVCFLEFSEHAKGIIDSQFDIIAEGCNIFIKSVLKEEVDIEKRLNKATTHGRSCDIILSALDSIIRFSTTVILEKPYNKPIYGINISSSIIARAMFERDFGKRAHFYVVKTSDIFFNEQRIGKISVSYKIFPDTITYVKVRPKIAHNESLHYGSYCGVNEVVLEKDERLNSLFQFKNYRRIFCIDDSCFRFKMKVKSTLELIKQQSAMYHTITKELSEEFGNAEMLCSGKLLIRENLFYNLIAFSFLQPAEDLNNVDKRVKDHFRTTSINSAIISVIKSLGDHPDLKTLNFSEIQTMLKSAILSAMLNNDSTKQYEDVEFIQQIDKSIELVYAEVEEEDSRFMCVNNALLYDKVTTEICRSMIERGESLECANRFLNSSRIKDYKSEYLHEDDALEEEFIAESMIKLLNQSLEYVDFINKRIKECKKDVNITHLREILDNIRLIKGFDPLTIILTLTSHIVRLGAMYFIEACVDVFADCFVKISFFLKEDAVNKLIEDDEDQELNLSKLTIDKIKNINSKLYVLMLNKSSTDVVSINDYDVFKKSYEIYFRNNPSSMNMDTREHKTVAMLIKLAKEKIKQHANSY